MKKPSEVHVAPFTYEVRWDNKTMNAVGGFGQLVNDMLLLYADPNVPLANRQDTLVHESLHAMWAQTQLVIEYPDGGEDSPGEKIIRNLAPRILAWIRDNPELIEYLRD